MRHGRALIEVRSVPPRWRSLGQGRRLRRVSDPVGLAQAYR